MSEPIPTRAVKRRVLKRFPDAYCVRLDDKTGYIVWPQREAMPRGVAKWAIGMGVTASKAWRSVKLL